MRTFILLVALGAIAAPAWVAPARAAPRAALERDLEGYAVASCLAAQKDETLRTQGEGWARMIVMGRAKGDFEKWRPLGDAVRSALNPADVPLLKPERAIDPAPELPLAYCGEIIDKPRVRVAIDMARRRLAADYRLAGTKK